MEIMFCGFNFRIASENEFHKKGKDIIGQNKQTNKTYTINK